MGYLNPLFKLPAAQGLLALDAREKSALGRLMMDLRRQANDEAERAWQRRKGPMACYWRAVSTYARHIAHVLRTPWPRCCGASVDATMAWRTITESTMTAQDIIAIFEDLSVSGRSAPLDDAIAGLAGWLAVHRSALSEEDFAALTAVGAAMFEAGLQRRMAPATFLPVR